MARRFLAARLDARHLDPCASQLEPYLLHQPGLPRVVTLDDAQALLLLHPRVQAPDQLPASLAASVTEQFEGRWVDHERPVPEPRWRALFVVQFASRSKDLPALAPGLPRSWRRYLSNFADPQPLRIDDHSYASVEHYFQGCKARCSDRPEMAQWFTREHEGPEQVGDDPRDAKRAGARKSYQTHGARLEVERWIEVREAVMQTAIEARWAQDELFRRVLLSTRGLQLLHFERAGARSFWGGSLDEQTGQIRGTNRLGTIMMERRDRR